MALKPGYEDLKRRVLKQEKEIFRLKNKEKRLRESELFFRTLTERSFAGIYVVQGGKFRSINHNAASYAGYLPEELIGKKSDSIVYLEDRRLVRMNASSMLRGKRTAPYEFRIVTKKGRIRWIMETVNPIHYDGKRAILGNSMDITEHKRAEEAVTKREKELEIKSQELAELNTALRVLLKSRENDKRTLEEQVLASVKGLILPYIEKMKMRHMDDKCLAYLGILESNLGDIISPFANKLSSKLMNLTNREIQVANLIKEGKTTKETSRLLNISDSAVNIHRYNIRNKLGLNKKHNLRVYLSSLA